MKKIQKIMAEPGLEKPSQSFNIFIKLNLSIESSQRNKNTNEERKNIIRTKEFEKVCIN